MEYRSEYEATKLIIRKKFCELKAKQIDKKNYTPGPKFDYVWEQAATKCIDIGADPELYVSAIFYYAGNSNIGKNKSEYLKKPFPNNLLTDNAEKLVNNYKQVIEQKVDSGEVDLIAHVKTAMNVLKQKLKMFEATTLEEKENLVLDDFRFSDPAYIKILVLADSEPVKRKYKHSAEEEINNNVFLKRTLEKHQLIEKIL